MNFDSEGGCMNFRSREYWYWITKWNIHMLMICRWWLYEYSSSGWVLSVQLKEGWVLPLLSSSCIGWRAIDFVQILLYWTAYEHIRRRFMYKFGVSRRYQWELVLWPYGAYYRSCNESCQLTGIPVCLLTSFPNRLHQFPLHCIQTSILSDINCRGCWL